MKKTFMGVRLRRLREGLQQLRPDVIALQELDKNTTWHQTDQLQELADRTGMRPYYCKTISYRGGDYGIGILCKTAPKNTYAGDLPGTEARKFFLAEFDGYIFVVAEYNRSITGALKNALDQAYVEWARKPFGAIGYGSMGAANALGHLQNIGVELQFAPLVTGVCGRKRTYCST